jgi:hypothetical protein
MKLLTFYYQKYASLLAWPLLVLAPLPILYFAFSVYTEMQTDLGARLELLHQKREHYEIQKKREADFVGKLKKSDHYYLDKYLESLTFLQPEIQKLENALATGIQDDELKQRLDFLKSGKNKLLFVEEGIERSGSLQEVEEKCKYAVEMNEQDLKKLLSVVEEVKIGSYLPPDNAPQLIVKNFDLLKKPTLGSEDVFEVHLSLIKRETLEE